MSQYLVLSHIDIQNANSIAGLTWGFPAITQFLGFTHALNRKISNDFTGKHSINLSGCSIVSHSHKQHVYAQNHGANYRFTQRKSSYTFKPKFKNKTMITPSIIEEGKMNLTVSLVIEIKQPLALTSDQKKLLEKEMREIVSQMRIAGGSILNIHQVRLLSASTDDQHKTLLRRVKRLVMPGFVLLDRSHYLKERYQKLLDEHDENADQDKPELLDAWLDFAALKYRAIPELSEDETTPDENTPANWERIEKPKPGYLVPIMVGYKAISEVYDEGVVMNTRDENTPSCFVEAVHSVGEWRSVHRMENIANTIWRYSANDQWYLCQQNTIRQEASEPESSNQIDLDSEQNLTLNEALSIF